MKDRPHVRSVTAPALLACLLLTACAGRTPDGTTLPNAVLDARAGTEATPAGSQPRSAQQPASATGSEAGRRQAATTEIAPGSDAAIAIDALNRKHYDEALVILEPIAADPAHTQYVIANRLLAVIYGRGTGVPRDPQRMLAHLHAAADAGNADAQVQLARQYDRGQDVARDPEQIYYWSRKAAAQGDPDGQQYLGWCHHFGIGTARDIERAMHFYRLAADNGHALAKNNLAAMLLSGEAPGGADPEQAVVLLEEAAAQQLPAAQLQLGILLASGRGVAQDRDRALQLLDSAARARSGIAAILAAQMLEEDGATARALDYYQLAQQLGVQEAAAQIRRLRANADGQ